MCNQQYLRSACAYAQSDQSVCYSLEYSLIVKLLTEHDLEFLSLKGGGTGSSESTHVKMPHFWKSHVTAHFVYLFQYSDEIYDYSPDHGVNDSFTHVVKNLDADTFYKLSVGARNGHGTEVLSDNTVEFWTKGIKSKYGCKYQYPHFSYVISNTRHEARGSLSPNIH